jgi:hypothetical protein
MVKQAKNSSLYQMEPLTPEDVSYPNYPIRTPEDILQLQADTANVVEGRVPLDSFDEDYQKRIKNYYRFYGTRNLVGGMQGTPPVARMMRSTLDLV